MPEPSEGLPSRQAAHLGQFLDALGDVELSVEEMRALVWLAGWEPHIVQGVVDVIRKARQAVPEAGEGDA